MSLDWQMSSTLNVDVFLSRETKKFKQIKKTFKLKNAKSEHFLLPQVRTLFSNLKSSQGKIKCGLYKPG